MTMIQASDISGILPEVIAFRRELHQWPELSGEEKETRDRLLRELKKTDCQIQLFDHHYGIMAVMKNGHGRCMAVRADMDALPVQEATGLSFESRHPGVMHACGHDVHMALALGSALYLDTHRDQWQG
ncbi:MAG: M20/M25/M40 family metallo-hydrolase, partial [Clostridia bacterium]|nr:M20/M25/M40 family metallo-hydrolase [Clostridia bacterium]